MKACVIGASGYTGRELVKLLLAHPKVELSVITSRSLAGQPVEKIIPQVTGIANGLLFSNPSVEELCGQQDLDIFFLALPHGTAASYAIALLAADKKVIDLSADFRLNSAETYKEFYGEEHPAKELLQKPNTDYPSLRGQAGKSPN